jgi:hypothetical protein
VTAISAYENLMQLKRGAQGWHGRASSHIPRSLTRELTVLHCHGGPPDGRVAKTLYDLLGASPDDDAERLKEAFHKASGRTTLMSIRMTRTPRSDSAASFAPMQFCATHTSGRLMTKR